MHHKENLSHSWLTGLFSMQGRPRNDFKNRVIFAAYLLKDIHKFKSYEEWGKNLHITRQAIELKLKYYTYTLAFIFLK